MPWGTDAAVSSFADPMSTFRFLGTMVGLLAVASCSTDAPSGATTDTNVPPESGGESNAALEAMGRGRAGRGSGGQTSSGGASPATGAGGSTTGAAGVANGTGGTASGSAGGSAKAGAPNG